INLLAVFRNGAGVWRSAPGRVPAIAAWRPVESLHELDLALLGHANEPGMRGPDEDPAQGIGTGVGEAEGLEVLGAGEVSEGDDSFPAVAFRPPDVAAVDDCPQPLPGLRRDRADAVSFQSRPTWTSF